jgi:hypothetical protein
VTLGNGIRAFKKASEKASEEDDSDVAGKTQAQWQLPQGSEPAKNPPTSAEKKV